MNTKKVCEYMRDGFPYHSIPVKLQICADVRKDDCKYHVPIIIDTQYVSFRQCFCGYQFRRDWG